MGHIYIYCKICQRLISQIYSLNSNEDKVYQVNFKCEHWNMEIKITPLKSKYCFGFLSFSTNIITINAISKCDACKQSTNVLNNLHMPTANKVHLIYLECCHDKNINPIVRYDITTKSQYIKDNSDKIVSKI
jgi:hypothetical protein